MTCGEFQDRLVADAPGQDALERHAAGCAACARLLAGHRELLAAARAWRDATPEPPAVLEERIVASLSGAGETVVSLEERGRATRRVRPWWLAAAALLVVSATVLYQLGFAPGSRGELANLMREAEAAQQSYARAIAKLERQAAPLLARAGDPAVDPRAASILLAYDDRLSHLDAVIAEVRGFLEENPGHSGGHTVLLAAYREKDEVLREVLALGLGDRS